MEEGIKIHRVLEGPYHISDVTGDDDDEGWFIEVLLEFDGELMDLTLMHTDLDKVTDIVNHFKKATIEPYIIGGEA